MDKIIERKKGWRAAFTMKKLPLWLGGVAVLAILWLALRPGHSTLRISADTIITGEVTRGEFNDYIRVNGTVQPMVSVQISPTEGGIVERKVLEEGACVKAGDIILVLSNEQLDLQILTAEAELSEKENILRNTMIQMEQQKLTVRQEKLQLEVDVKRTERDYLSKKALFEEKLIAREEFLKAEEDYMLAKDKLDLVAEREKQDEEYRTVEIEQMRESLESMRANMALIRHRKDNLNIKAPIDGEIGLLDAFLGQSISPGTKIGQINDLSSYKIEAQIDEHYIDRVNPGLSADFDRNGEKYGASIRKVYPEVRDGKFKADFRFEGRQPDNVRAGQTCYLNVRLGASEEAVLVPRGSFFQTTGGKWIYVLNKAGTEAVKREVRIGRQNPQYYEVLEGLAPGEKVIISGYDGFDEKDILTLKQ